MYTIAFFTRRVPGMSHEQFLEHYRTTHFALASKMPGLVSYMQSELLHGDEAWSGGDSFEEYDAFSLYVYESKEAADAAYASAEGVLVDEDTPKFMEWASIRAGSAQVIQRFDATEPIRPVVR